MMPPTPVKKCTRENCPPASSNDFTSHCFICKDIIHWHCYEINKPPGFILISPNIVTICDGCLNNPKAYSSPKHKQPSVANLVQRTIESKNSVMSLSKSVTVPQVSTPPKNNTAKQSQQIQTAVESLIQKVEVQTAAIEGLKISVETMNGTISQQNVPVGESKQVNNEIISSIKKSIPQTTKNIMKKSYAEATKQVVVTNETPKSTIKPWASKTVLTGTSTKVIGRPLVNDHPKTMKQEKAIWISRVHRETTEEEMTLYIKNSIKITSPDISVRKLVKNDRDLSTYSFISFRIMCSTSNFNMLMDPMHWPSYCQIREFDLEQTSSVGGKLIHGIVGHNRTHNAS